MIISQSVKGYPIKSGDEVTVYFTDDYHITATVLGKPSATGDTWKLKEEDGNIVYLNPNSSDFSMMRKKVDK